MRSGSVEDERRFESGGRSLAEFHDALRHDERMLDSEPEQPRIPVHPTPPVRFSRTVRPGPAREEARETGRGKRWSGAAHSAGPAMKYGSEHRSEQDRVTNDAPS